MSPQNLFWVDAETMDLLKSDQYESHNGTMVPIGARIRGAVQHTLCYTPTETLPSAPTSQYETKFSVVNATTLSQAKGMADRGLRVAVLNFASAKRPGGGFGGGAVAQEEYLCRLSGLYPCLKEMGRPMYEAHKHFRSSLYTSWVIYSPDVPVFRNDNYELLDTPWDVSVLTCPAPNLSGSGKLVSNTEVRQILHERAGRVLSVAESNGHDALVLGAWGCGVFGCSPKMVAEVFRDLLTGPFSGAFREVAFAVYDRTLTLGNITPFTHCFPTTG
jgi:uncharacterized protein (TIGR02452 family)